MIIKRNFSSIKNELEYLFTNLSKKHNLPYFKVYQGQIEVLKEPIDFYINLHEQNKVNLEQAQAVYIWEQEIQKNIQYYFMNKVAIMSSKIKKSYKFSLTIILDFFRGTRINKQNESSLSLLAPLQNENYHNKNVKIGFFGLPVVNKFLYDLNDSPLREIFGVHHMKYYIFDNDVIITGANLSEDYFTTRQDRYYVVRNCPELANYLMDLLSILQSNSQILDQLDTLQSFNSQPRSKEKKEFKKIFNQQFKIFLYSNKKKYEFEKELNLNNDKDYCKQNDLKFEESQNQDMEEQMQDKVEYDITDIEHIKENKELQTQLSERKQQAIQILSNSFNEGEVSNIIRNIEQTLYKEKENQELVPMGGFVYIFPVINIPFINYDKDEKLLLSLLEYLSLNQQNKIQISTAYFNFPSKILEIMKKSKAQIEIVTSSPQANSFYEAGFVKKQIPRLYRYLEYKFLSKNLKNVKLYEWLYENQTFHSKGLWVSNQQTKLTVIGSSNFGQRSYTKDSELQFYLYSECPDFQNELKEEVQHQFNHAQEVQKSHIEQDKKNKLSLFLRPITKFISKYL